MVVDSNPGPLVFSASCVATTAQVQRIICVSCWIQMMNLKDNFEINITTLHSLWGRWTINLL